MKKLPGIIVMFSFLILTSCGDDRNRCYKDNYKYFVEKKKWDPERAAVTAMEICKQQ
jgi:hypothetical protein|tara:strand:+ start:735 stop:905 length:171 start_codon:yes stop_codon:yes gene_type:complete